MAIYDLGTASLSANGEVTGVGTTWKAPLTLIRVGATIVFKTEPVKIYTISEIISDTQINVYNPNSETVPAGTGYAILAHDGITVQGLAQDVAETLRHYQSRETAIAEAVDVFKDFDHDKFSTDVNQVNTQFGEIVTIASQVSSDASQVSADKDSASSSASSASNSAIVAQSAAESVSGALVGNFDDGVTLQSKNQVIIQFIDGYAVQFLWSGTLPKVVPAGSTPESSGGIGPGAWVRASDTSLRANLASGSGSSLVTYTNPNGPGVPMPLDVRVGQTYFMSDYGVSPSSTAEENTARINSVFSSLGGQSFISQFVFDCKGVVLVNGSLLLKNNMDVLIHAGTEIRNVEGTNMPLFISEYWFDTISNPSDLTKKSDYLGIRGGGIINYNKSGTAPGGLNTHAICIAGVKRLKLGGGLKVGGAFKYAYLVANIDYLDAQGLEFDNHSDGLHLQPPIYHAYVRNLRGHTGDDLFAMTGGDYASYDLGTRGNFTFIDVEGLFNDTTLCAVKLAGNDGVEFKHVSVRGIHGTCQHAPVRIWADHNLTKTTVKYAIFDDISAIPGAGHALCEIYDRGLGEVFADQVVVEGVSTNLTNISTPVVDVRGSVGVTVYNLDMDAPRNSKFGFACGEGSGNDKSRILNVNIKSKNTLLSGDQYSSLCLVTRGVVDNVTIKGSVDHKTEATLCQIRGGTLKNINISDMVYSNGHLFRQFAANADASSPRVILSNVTGANSGKLALFYSGGMVTASNVTLISTSGNPIETTAAGIVDIYGAINYGNSLIPSNAKSGFNYRAYGFGLTVDAANLQRTGNQSCTNNNASFGTGTGLIAFATGTGWKNIVTGATG
ncbi:lateral tail fiber protein [Escherichia phage AugustePiccard]|uniref:Lateral tail fiber protein n=1 Tax=Escherichia phage AugustePiccard TaxID=2851954 RepID=A0AAE8B5I6_9CAUD|nr:lateral tail fiber protein [Escherichia phage AugustePiccard]